MSGSLKDGFAEAVTSELKKLDTPQKDYSKPISVRFSGLVTIWFRSLESITLIQRDR